jgi:hypothetical protein
MGALTLLVLLALPFLALAAVIALLIIWIGNETGRSSK